MFVQKWKRCDKKKNDDAFFCEMWVAIECQSRYTSRVIFNDRTSGLLWISCTYQRRLFLSFSPTPFPIFTQVFFLVGGIVLFFSCNWSRTNTTTKAKLNVNTSSAYELAYYYYFVWSFLYCWFFLYSFKNAFFSFIQLKLDSFFHRLHFSWWGTGPFDEIAIRTHAFF